MAIRSLIARLALLCAVLFLCVLGDLHVTTDGDGNTVISVPKQLCLKPGGGEATGGLEDVVNAIADCSKQGKGYDRSLKKCVTPPLTSSSVVANPLADADRPYRLSLLYCHWSSTRFSSCSSLDHSYGGNANFRISSTVVSGRLLTIPFQSPYSKEPICSVTFENVAVFALLDTQRPSIVISLRDSGGGFKDWSTVSSWIYVICHGVM